MARVKNQGGRVKVGKKLRAEIENETGGPKILALRGAVMAFIKKSGGGSGDEADLEEGELSLEEIEARFHGAEVVNKLSDVRLTHVVVIGKELRGEQEMIAQVKEERSRRLTEGKNIFHLVSSAWMEVSVRENRMVSEGEYIL